MCTSHPHPSHHTCCWSTDPVHQGTFPSSLQEGQVPLSELVLLTALQQELKLKGVCEQVAARPNALQWEGYLCTQARQRDERVFMEQTLILKASKPYQLC